jgi:hypothetical protein
MKSFLELQAATAVAALSALSSEVSAYHALTDASLLELTRLFGLLQRTAGTNAALVAGEVARRSAPSLGHAGLAQATGHRTPEQLIRSTTGGTGREAAQSVRIGRIATGEDSREWLAPVGVAVVEGLSVAAAESISNGLGVPTAGVTADELAAAAVQLCEEAASLDADRLYRRARAVRNEIDAAGIADCEATRRAQRALRFFTRPDGMTRLTWDLDPETAALVGALYDRATSPRRGGPRFVETEAATLAGRIEADPRTTPQLASDTFLQLLLAGADADSTQLLGTGAPSIRVLVADTELRSRTGHGYIEGQHDPISIDTVERLVCGGSVVSVSFDQDQPLDVGREQRLYTRRQRIALAARDGGCRWPGCERPPSWAEAHHTQHWARDHGRTDTADGILLCRHHHRLAHNNHWEIQHRQGDYWLTPPPEIDPLQRPRPMPTKSAAARELQRA